MPQSKITQSIILLLFMSLVMLIIFVLLRMQLSSFMSETNRKIVATSPVVKTAKSALVSKATMAALTLDMLTVQPKANLTVSVTIMPSPTAPALDKALVPATGAVNTDLVNIRSYPSLAGEVVGQARVGTQLQIIEKSNDGLWVQVCCPLGTSESSVQSWISAEFIDIAPQSTLASAPAPTTTGNTIAGNGISATVTTLANVRSGPDTSYATIGQVSQQTQLTITGRNAAGTWWRICCPPGAPAESWVSVELVTFGIPQSQALAETAVVAVAPAPSAIPTDAASPPTPVLRAP